MVVGAGLLLAYTRPQGWDLIDFSRGSGVSRVIKTGGRAQTGCLATLTPSTFAMDVLNKISITLELTLFDVRQSRSIAVLMSEKTEYEHKVLLKKDESHLIRPIFTPTREQLVLLDIRNGKFV